ncbi:hypothetical protein M407DRAFT_246915, partial [Tulasnella calospora MUT 4182]
VLTDTNNRQALMHKDSFLPDIASRPIWTTVSLPLRAGDHRLSFFRRFLDAMNCKDTAHLSLWLGLRERSWTEQIAKE